MPPKLRPCLESLEGRMLLSTVKAPTAPVAEMLNFVAPGTTTSGVHAVASQQASSVTLTLQRGEPGLKISGSIQVEVATGPIPTPSTPVPSAQPGVQYQPVVETITFPPGVRSESVKIPIVAGAANPGMLSFEVAAIQLGVQTTPDSYGQATEDVFLAQNINAPVPRITSAHMVLSGHRTSDFVLQFSMPMDPASVQNVGAYDVSDTTYHEHDTAGFLGWLVQGIPGLGYSSSSSPVVLKTATYNPSTNTVDLHLAKSVDARDVYQIGSGPTVLDAAGTPINEDGTGLGDGFSITLTNKKATIFDGVTQSVIPVSPPRR
jgi:hypothetical protein